MRNTFFVEFQFNYRLLIWEFHSSNLNNKINRLHEKTLKIVYSDFKAKFAERLRKDGSFSIYYRYIET